MAKKSVDLFVKAGYRPTKSLPAKTRERLWSQLSCSVPADLRSLYESCNGARSRKAECRILPLAEAIELITAFDAIESFRFLPFFESENAASNPCMFVLDGPLKGYVYHHLHDGVSRVLAPDISRFAMALGKPGTGRVDLDDASFDYPRTLSAKDKKVVQTILAKGKQADSLLRDLASSMSEEKKMGWSAQKCAEDKDYARFLDRCEAIFTKARIQVVRDDQSGLLVGPMKKGFFWYGLQQQQKGKDLEKFILGFVQPKLG